MTNSGSPAVHLIGVGGAGMSGIARVLLQRGRRVSGSDLQHGRMLEELRMLGGRIEVGHDAANLGDADIVVISTAVPDDNPEVLAARRAGLPVLRRAQMLAELMSGDTAVAVTGTHGKTTTTSMTVVALQSDGGDPSFVIGGSLNESGTNAHAGLDPVFVAEADESDRSFLHLRPNLAVITNIEHEHPDVYADLADTVASFRSFLDQRPEGAPAVLCADDEATARLAQQVNGPVVTYGFSPQADVRIVSDGVEGDRLRYDGEDVAPLELAVPGRHNLLNAAAALVSCHLLGADITRCAAGLARFAGVARRFQRLGTAAGIDVVDDYAHHPTELRATLEAARASSSGRVVLVVQPHRYSRTAVLGAELGRAAAAADQLIVTDVYGAGEDPIPGVTGNVVAEAARAAGGTVRYVAHLGDVVDALLDEVERGDLVLVTGAGDVTNVGPGLLARLGGAP